MRRLAILYLLALHVFLVAVIIVADVPQRLATRLRPAPPPEKPHYVIATESLHDRLDKQVSGHPVIFLGDSHVQALYTDAIASPSANFGVSGATTAGLCESVPKRSCLSSASVIILAVGCNDLPRRGDAEIIANYERLLGLLPRRPVVVAALLPVGRNREATVANARDRTEAINHQLRRLAESNGFVFASAGKALSDEAGYLRREYDLGDGLHLSTAGYAVWSAALAKAVGQAQKKRP